MWAAIDVNDNGYASLSEITRVSESWVLWMSEFQKIRSNQRASEFCQSFFYGVIWRGMISNDAEKGVRDVIDSDDLFDSRPAINRAFHHCRKLAKVLYCHGWEFTRGLFPDVQMCRVIGSTGTTISSSRSFAFSFAPFDSSLNTTRRLKGLESYQSANESMGIVSGWTPERTKGSRKRSSRMTRWRKQ